jgi:hypothetical protein
MLLQQQHMLLAQSHQPQPQRAVRTGGLIPLRRISRGAPAGGRNGGGSNGGNGSGSGAVGLMGQLEFVPARPSFLQRWYTALWAGMCTMTDNISALARQQQQLENGQTNGARTKSKKKAAKLMKQKLQTLDQQSAGHVLPVSSSVSVMDANAQDAFVAIFRELIDSALGPALSSPLSPMSPMSPTASSGRSKPASASASAPRHTLMRISLINDGLQRVLGVFWQRSWSSSAATNTGNGDSAAVREALLEQLIRLAHANDPSSSSAMIVIPSVQRAALRLLRRILPSLPPASGTAP